MNKGKIILPGGAGLVGQNLVARLKAKGYNDIVVLDKHCANLAILKQVHPDITAEYVDLADLLIRERFFLCTVKRASSRLYYY